MCVKDAAISAKSNIMMYAVGANGTGEDFSKIGSDYCRLFSMASFENNLQFLIPDLASGICSGNLPQQCLFHQVNPEAFASHTATMFCFISCFILFSDYFKYVAILLL